MRRSAAEILREYGPFPGVGHVAGVTYDGQHVMDLQEEPGASFPDRRGLGPAMRRGSRLLMQRPEALLNHLSRFHVRRRVLGSERTVNERPRPVANLLG